MNKDGWKSFTINQPGWEFMVESHLNNTPFVKENVKAMIQMINVVYDNKKREQYINQLIDIITKS